MRAVIYTRVSTDEQAESGAGLQAQTDACAAHAARAGLEAIGPFTDEGVSGAAPLDKRPGLVDALAALEPGDVLLVSRRDRLGRDPVVVAMIERATSSRKARVVSASGEGTEDDGPASVLMRRIIDAFAEYERLLIMARTRAAMMAKRRRGDRTGPVPYGYDLVDDGRRTRKDNPCALTPNPAEQAVIAEIREMTAAGRTPREIARTLQDRGTPSKTGAEWSPQAIRRILARSDPAPTP